MSQKREQRPVGSAKAAPEILAGGYHSRGVPGEEADVRSQMRVVRLNSPNRFIRNSWPLKGGGGAESTAEARLDFAELGVAPHSAGPRAVFVLTRKGTDQLETPVFEAGEEGKDRAIAVFTRRELAYLYLQVSDWSDEYEPVDLRPTDLGQWVREARNQGINLLAVDLNRQAHLRGEPQAVVDLGEEPDLSGENIYREVQDCVPG